MDVTLEIENKNISGLQTVELLKSGTKVSADRIKLEKEEAKSLKLTYDIESGDADENADFTVKTDNDSVEFSVDIATLEKKFGSGWNYFSLPIATQARPEISQILPEEKVSAVWRYEDGSWQSYAPSAQENPFNAFKGGEGYIVRTSEGFTVRPNVQNTMEADSVENSNPSSEDLQQGWNLIGHYWSQGMGAESSMQSVKENDRGKIYGPKSSGLNLDTHRFNSAMFPGEAYWLLVRDDSVYAKDKVSGEDYTVDWSQVPVYQIGEKVDKEDYEANIDWTESKIDSRNSNIRNVEIRSYFENSNISVNESFDGISFENEIVTESGKIHELNNNNVVGLRKGESWGDSRLITRTLSKEIPKDNSPEFLRTKVLSDRGLEGSFIYNISDYLEWRIPELKMDVVEGTGVQSDVYRYHLLDNGKLEFSRQTGIRQESDWKEVNKDVLTEHTKGEVYVFNESKLSSELNVTEDYRPYELIEEVKKNALKGKDVSEYDSSTEVCSKSLSRDASFECNVSDKFNGKGWRPMYWQIERTDKQDIFRGEESQIKLVDERQVDDPVDFQNVSINITSIRGTNDLNVGQRLKIDLRVNSTILFGSQLNLDIIGDNCRCERSIYVHQGKKNRAENKTVEILTDPEEYSNEVALQIQLQETFQRNQESVFFDIGPKVTKQILPNLQSNISNQFNYGLTTKSNVDEIKLVNEITGYDDDEKKEEGRLDSLLQSVNATIFISKTNEYYYEVKKNYDEYSEHNLDAYNSTAVYKCESKYNVSESSFSCNISEANLSAGYEYNVFWNISAGDDILNKQGKDEFNLVKKYQLNETAETNDVVVKMKELKSTIGYDGFSEIELTSFFENKNLTHPDGNTETELVNKLLFRDGRSFERHYNAIRGPSSVKIGESGTETRDTPKPDEGIDYILSSIDRAGAGERRMTPIFLFETSENFDLNSSDDEAPELGSFNLSDNEVNTTESFNISIEASDDDSGVFKANVVLRNIHDVSKEYSLSDFDNGSIEKEVSAPDVETTFSVNLEIFDEAGNKGVWQDVGEISVK